MILNVAKVRARFDRCEMTNRQNKRKVKQNFDTIDGHVCWVGRFQVMSNNQKTELRRKELLVISNNMALIQIKIQTHIVVTGKTWLSLLLSFAAWRLHLLKESRETEPLHYTKQLL